QQESKHFQNQSSVLENVGSVLGGLFDIQPSETDYDPDEAELLQQHRPKKKKKRGFHSSKILDSPGLDSAHNPHLFSYFQGFNLQL
ncbi:hypothetical protein EZS27_044402, partial [termite gut metagenome]